MKRRPGVARPASEEEKVMSDHHHLLPKIVVILQRASRHVAGLDPAIIIKRR
jgi:hypothetical protein